MLGVWSKSFPEISVKSGEKFTARKSRSGNSAKASSSSFSKGQAWKDTPTRFGKSVESPFGNFVSGELAQTSFWKTITLTSSKVFPLGSATEPPVKFSESPSEKSKVSGWHDKSSPGAYQGREKQSNSPENPRTEKIAKKKKKKFFFWQNFSKKIDFKFERLTNFSKEIYRKFF